MSEREGEIAPIYVCRCEEVTAAEVEAAIDAGAQSVNDVKRRTRAGMGLCQGIYCVATIAVALHEATGTPLAAIVPMTARPPVRPISLDLLAEAE